MIILSFETNYDKVLELGQASSVKTIGRFKVYKIFKRYWAPGVWAGMESQVITVNNQLRAIIGIDLDNRLIVTESVPRYKQEIL